VAYPPAYSTYGFLRFQNPDASDPSADGRVDRLDIRVRGDAECVARGSKRTRRSACRRA
jgi:hypothetical protein